MTIRNLKPISAKFITGAAVLALIAGLSLGIAPQAYAYDCLLDTNNDGNADTDIDTDGGADSGGDNARLACGVGASAAGSNSTAFGRDASALGSGSTALGSFASAALDNSTAVGGSASAAEDSTALGRNSSATGFSSMALGYFADAAGNQSTALGRGTNFDGPSGDFSIAIGTLSNAGGVNAIAIGADTADAGSFGAGAQGANSIVIGADAGDGGFAGAVVVGTFASVGGSSSTALGLSASAAGNQSTALGRSASAAGSSSTALGYDANAAGTWSTAVGSLTNNGVSSGPYATAIGYAARSQGINAIAIGASTGAAAQEGADAQGDHSIVIGTEASDAGFAGVILLGKDTLATEANQVILKSADTFTILGNGDAGIGTAAPMGSLDINSGASDTTFLLTNSMAQWELKNKASTGRLNFKNLTTSGVPFKLGPNSVNGLLSVGTAAADVVEVRGDLDVTGTLTTGGPTCGGGCDAVFGADYDLPTIEEHAKAMYANSYLPQVGPTVPHAPMNISEKVGDMLNELEKAHIYIAQMQAAGKRRDVEKQALQSRLEQQGAELEVIKQQIEYLLTP